MTGLSHTRDANKYDDDKHKTRIHTQNTRKQHRDHLLQYGGCTADSKMDGTESKGSSEVYVGGLQVK